MDNIVEFLNWNLSYAGEFIRTNPGDHFRAIFWLGLIFSIVSSIVSYFISKDKFQTELEALSKTFDRNNLEQKGKEVKAKLNFFIILFFVFITMFLMLCGIFLGNIGPGWFIVAGLLLMFAVDHVAIQIVKRAMPILINREAIKIFHYKWKISYNKIKNFQSDLI